MEHLALEVFDRDGSGSKYAFLPSDTSITITDTSEIFDSGDIWSHAFKLNIPANAHIFGSAGEIHGSRLHEQIDKRRARLWVEGLPLYYGYLRLDDEVDVDEYGDVNVSFESGRKTFHDMIDGAKANQVPLMGDVLIGMAVDRERPALSKINAEITIDGVFGGNHNDVTDSLTPGSSSERTSRSVCPAKIYYKIPPQQLPKFVKPYGDWKKDDGSDESIAWEDTVNTDYGYDGAHPPYCNVPVCYQDHEWRANDSGDMEIQKVRRLHVSDATRINPAPNFFVLYWLDCLMKHLDIHIKENQMSTIEDLTRLFFVNTKCAYETKETQIYRDTFDNISYIPFVGNNPIVVKGENDVEPSKINLTEHSRQEYKVGLYTGDPDFSGATAKLTRLDSVGSISLTWHKAYATSDNFPDVNITEVIEAIEAAFGVRLLFNKDYTQVRVILLRNVLRSNEVQELNCEVISNSKQENSIRGFRMTYGGAEDDTSYNYKGFIKAKTKIQGNWLTPKETHDYSKFSLENSYSDVLKYKDSLDPTCRIVSNTGNSYVVKIDDDSKDPNEWFPSLFEVGQFMDAEDGDCSGEEDTIKEIRLGFTPVGVIVTEDKGSGEEQFAIFVDKEMSVSADMDIVDNSYSLPEYADRVTGDGDAVNGSSVIQNAAYLKGLFEVATQVPITAKFVNLNNEEVDYFPLLVTLGGIDTVSLWYEVTSSWINEGYRLYLDDNYKINDEMECPLEQKDWGLSLGILRESRQPSGTVTPPRVRYEDDLEEGEGNESWEKTQGMYAKTHPDICDDYGSIFNTSYVDTSNSVSLKLRAEKPNVNATPAEKKLKEPQYVTTETTTTETVVTSKEDARQAILQLFNTGNHLTKQNLLDTSRFSRANLKTELGNSIPWALLNDTVCISHEKYDENDIFIGYEWEPVNMLWTTITRGGGKHNLHYMYNEDWGTPGGYIGEGPWGRIFGPLSLNEFLEDEKYGGHPMGEGLVIDTYSSKERMDMLYQLLWIHAGSNEEVHNYHLPNGYSYKKTVTVTTVITQNPDVPSLYYDKTRPEGVVVVTNKDYAKRIMSSMFAFCNTDLFNRPEVPLSDLREKGWEADGDGYATVFSVGIGVTDDKGIMHEILWTPIQEDGQVLSELELRTYIHNLEGLSVADMREADFNDKKLLLDIDTDETRADILHKLQELYYTPNGTKITPVILPPNNSEFLGITDSALQHRGLADKFYREYSYWVRNARISKKQVIMNISQIISIDKTKKIRIGDLIGFIKNMQYSVDIQTGLGMVTLEIWYL